MVFFEKLFTLKEHIYSFFYSRHISSSSTRALLLSSSGNAHGLFYPFHYYRSELAAELQFFFKEIISDDLIVKRKLLENFDGDLVFISMPLRINGQILPKKTVLEFFQSLKPLKRLKIIYFDVSDNAISPYFDILPYVDLFLMPFTFKDKSNYHTPFLGGNMFADFMANHYALEPNQENQYFGELFFSSPAKKEIDKITLSWNWVLWRKMINAFQCQNFRCSSNKNREIDISCRFHPYSGWCAFHRMNVYEKLKAMPSSLDVKISTKKLALKDYYKELENAKISFSPFGYGEICPKDFETIMKGALLVKPSVEHLKTFPQLHIPYETYVPVAWDLSDMTIQLEKYLKDDEKRLKLVNNASQIYREFFLSKSFLSKISEILKLLA